MKILRRIILAVLVLIVLAVVGLYLALNSLVRRGIEKAASDSLNVPTTLGSASISLLGGGLTLADFQVGSPPGFQAPHILALGQGDLRVSLARLRQDPVRIDRIDLAAPRLVIEQNAGRFNFQVLMDQMPKSEGSSVKLVIDKLIVRDAVVSMRPGLPGLDKQIDVPVPSLELDKVGTGPGNENGSAVKQVVLEVITALAAKAGNADLPKQLQESLRTNAQAVADRISADARKKIDELAKPLGDALKGTGIDLGSELQKALGGEKTRRKAK